MTEKKDYFKRIIKNIDLKNPKFLSLVLVFYVFCWGVIMPNLFGGDNNQSIETEEILSEDKKEHNADVICDLSAENAWDCLKIQLNKNLLLYLHIWTITIGGFTIFLANLIGNQLGANKHEKIFLGLLIIVAGVPFILFMRITNAFFNLNIIFIILGWLFFMWVVKYLIYINNITFKLKSKNIYISKLLNIIYEPKYLLIFLSILLSLHLLLSTEIMSEIIIKHHHKYINEIVFHKINSVLYFIFFIMFLIHQLLTKIKTNDEYEGTIRYDKKKEIHFKKMKRTEDGFFLIFSKDNKIIELNKERIKEIEYEYKDKTVSVIDFLFYTLLPFIVLYGFFVILFYLSFLISIPAVII